MHIQRSACRELRCHNQTVNIRLNCQHQSTLHWDKCTNRVNQSVSPFYRQTENKKDIVCPTWPCFQHSRKIFQLLLLLGSCRQSRRPSHSHVWEVWGSRTLRPITPSLRGTTAASPASDVPPAARRPSVFLVSTTEAMMWSKMFGRPPLLLSL